MRTRLCDLLGIDVPIIQASLGPWTSVELSDAVSTAGGLGTIGTALMPSERVADLLREMQERTDRPFAVNFSARGPSIQPRSTPPSPPVPPRSPSRTATPASFPHARTRPEHGSSRW
jgi:NAD(P)H-dependent flavin oxidoreductase YrpB (nitropropane dioxygenase family)